MKRFLRTTAVIASTAILSASFSGCAAMFHGSTQQVAVRSNVPGTELYVNEAFVGKDNGVTTFQKRNS